MSATNQELEVTPISTEDGAMVQLKVGDVIWVRNTGNWVWQGIIRAILHSGLVVQQLTDDGFQADTGPKHMLVPKQQIVL